MDTGIYMVSKKIKLKQGGYVTEIREVLECYEEVRDEVHLNISIAWEKWKEDNAEKIQEESEVM